MRLKALPLVASFFCFSFLFTLSCKDTEEQAPKDIHMDSVTISMKMLQTPCVRGGEPNLFCSPGGAVYLSWVEQLNDTTNALLFSTLENDEWSKPKTIATGSDWFVNWADFPVLVTYGEDEASLAAHWLQMSASGTYDYDIKVSQSFDRGDTWTAPFTPHTDGIAAEHGFVSMLPLSSDKIFITWLDGRNTKQESKGAEHDGSSHRGAMTLRAAIFDKEAKLSHEVELDPRVCDCCQTTAALTTQGIVLAYRDRSEEEIRDIAILRQVEGEWTEPRIVFPDNWHMPGCPVNGPALAATNNNVALAWFTMADDTAKVKVALSSDGAEHFHKPICVDEGNPLGRVDVVSLEKGGALVSWLEDTEQGAAIKLVKVYANGSRSKSVTIAKSSKQRKSGFPRMVKVDKQILLAWTSIDGNITHVKTAIILMDKFG